MNSLRTPKFFVAIILTGLFFSCNKKKDDVAPVVIEKEVPVTAPAFRGNFNYDILTATTAYDSLFLDASGNKTVDMTEGNLRLNMFAALNTEIGKVNGNGVKKLNADSLKSMFSGFSFINPDLNNTGHSIKEATAKSTSGSPAVYEQFNKWFTEIENASNYVNDSALAGKPGKVTAKRNAAGNIPKYLVDTLGLEIGQLIQKGLIGAFQYDYIANVLFSDSKLNADNHHLVPGKNYTELEHNWDEAFATLTDNKVYAIRATDIASTGERFLGSYTREYGNSAYGNDFLKIHPAFLRGRAAIVNNDIAEVKRQAEIIKTIFEKVMARAAFNYIKKWNANNELGADQAAGKHQLAEGLGFIYSLRFCKLHGADAQFSEELLNDLVYSNTNGVWGLSPAKANAAIAKIQAKFSVQ